MRGKPIPITAPGGRPPSRPTRRPCRTGALTTGRAARAKSRARPREISAAAGGSVGAPPGATRAGESPRAHPASSADCQWVDLACGAVSEEVGTESGVPTVTDRLVNAGLSAERVAWCSARRAGCGSTASPSPTPHPPRHRRRRSCCAAESTEQASPKRPIVRLVVLALADRVGPAVDRSARSCCAAVPSRAPRARTGVRWTRSHGRGRVRAMRTLRTWLALRRDGRRLSLLAVARGWS